MSNPERSSFEFTFSQIDGDQLFISGIGGRPGALEAFAAESGEAPEQILKRVERILTRKERAAVRRQERRAQRRVLEPVSTAREIEPHAERLDRVIALKKAGLWIPRKQNLKLRP